MFGFRWTECAGWVGWPFRLLASYLGDCMRWLVNGLADWLDDGRVGVVVCDGACRYASRCDEFQDAFLDFNPPQGLIDSLREEKPKPKWRVSGVLAKPKLLDLMIRPVSE